MRSGFVVLVVEVVLIPIAQVERIVDLCLPGRQVGWAERRELGAADEAILVRVDVLHGAPDLGGGGGRANGRECTGELNWVDLAVTIAVKLVEDILELALASTLRLRLSCSHQTSRS